MLGVGWHRGTEAATHLALILVGLNLVLPILNQALGEHAAAHVTCYAHCILGLRCLCRMLHLVDRQMKLGCMHAGLALAEAQVLRGRLGDAEPSAAVADRKQI